MVFFAVFLVVMSLLCAAGTLLVWLTWRRMCGPAGSWILLLALGYSLAFAPTLILASRKGGVLIQASAWLSGIALGGLTFFLAAAIVARIVGKIAKLAGWQVSPASIAYTCFALAGLVIVYAVVNAWSPRVVQVEVGIQNLPPQWNGRRIVMFSDVHLGNQYGRRFLKRVVDKVGELDPDMVCIPGDMFDGASIDLDRYVEPLKDLRAPRGVYFVSGNHDEFRHSQRLLEAVAGTGTRVLQNEKIEVDGLQVVGVLDGELVDEAAYRDVLLRAGIERDRAAILIAHQPVNLKIAEAAGISLQLSGHTHGGQFWPWTHVAQRVHKRFNHGLQRLGKMQVYTSYGVGAWGPPMRIGTHSEIVLLKLRAL